MISDFAARTSATSNSDLPFGIASAGEETAAFSPPPSQKVAAVSNLSNSSLSPAANTVAIASHCAPQPSLVQVIATPFSAPPSISIAASDVTTGAGRPNCSHNSLVVTTNSVPRRLSVMARIGRASVTWEPASVGGGDEVVGVRCRTKTSAGAASRAVPVICDRSGAASQVARNAIASRIFASNRIAEAA